MAEITLEKLAEMTRDEFAHIKKEMATKEVVRSLHEMTTEEFRSVREEIRDGFRAVLAAVETVEYTKLRMRLDAVEERLERVEQR